MANGVVKTSVDLCTEADTNLSDNTQGLISPQDVREIVKNIIASGQSPFGGFHLSSSVETIIATISTFVKVAGTTIVTPNIVQFSMPTDNRLQYIGSLSNRTFVLGVSLSATAASNNQLLHLIIAKNGDPTDPESITTIMERTHGVGAEAGSITLIGHMTLSPNDFVELFISNETGTANVTVKRINFTIVGISG